jgi:hypothetical protein
MTKVLNSLIAAQQVHAADALVENAVRDLRTASSLYAKADAPILAQRYATLAEHVKQEVSR